MRNLALSLLTLCLVGLTGCEIHYRDPQGPCPSGSSATGGTSRTCVPDCRGVECGGDGCGGSCGTCPASATCSAGACTSRGASCDPIAQDCRGAAEACYPDVTIGWCAPAGHATEGQRCAYDNDCVMGEMCVGGGCRAICETTDPGWCGRGQTCRMLSSLSRLGFCDVVAAGSCVPDCRAGCGDDGCGGWCGDCVDRCVPDCSSGCGDDGCGGWCGDCADRCVPDCSWGCGDDGCGGWCGDCADSCVPDCSWGCGDDGCGGWCGEC